jgi:cell division protein FtsL
MWSLLKDFYRFSKQEKKLWLIPLIVILLLLGVILVFTASSGISWALYPFL